MLVSAVECLLGQLNSIENLFLILSVQWLLAVPIILGAFKKRRVNETRHMFRLSIVLFFPVGLNR